MRASVCLLFAACTAAPAPVTVDPGEATDGGKADGPSSTATPDVRCSGTPDAGGATDFNHLSSSLISALGSPRHRGFDLIGAASDGTQTIEGWISYTVADKALEDEDVDVFACRHDQWAYLSTARTDDEGHFALALEGSDRLPIAMRDLYVSVAGDRTGTGFLALVAADDAPLLVSDVDGTLTSSESAFFETIALGIEPDAQPHAATAYTHAATNGLQPVYLTARGNRYTDDTRQWLADRGFPRGPLRLAPSFLTLPGGDTIDYKTTSLEALALPVARGVGNRASDITAYTNAGLSPDQIFILTPEYASELAAPIAAGQASGFTDYATLPTDI